jgi:hypothetical protein
MTQGLASLAELIARTGLVDIEGLEVHVTILDFKSAYGGVRLLITPINGASEKWILMDRLKLDNGPTANTRASVVNSVWETRKS